MKLQAWVFKADHTPSNFLKPVFHKFHLVHSWILWPICIVSTKLKVDLNIGFFNNFLQIGNKDTVRYFFPDAGQLLKIKEAVCVLRRHTILAFLEKFHPVRELYLGQDSWLKNNFWKNAEGRQSVISQAVQTRMKCTALLIVANWLVKYILNTEAVAQRCSIKKKFLEISQNSQENTCNRVSF